MSVCLSEQLSPEGKQVIDGIISLSPYDIHIIQRLLENQVRKSTMTKLRIPCNYSLTKCSITHCTILTIEEFMSLYRTERCPISYSDGILTIKGIIIPESDGFTLGMYYAQKNGDNIYLCHSYHPCFEQNTHHGSL